MVRDPGQSYSGNGHHPPGRKKGNQKKVPRPEYPTLSPDFGFVPQVQPLPLHEAIRQLPARYRFILTKPGLESFLGEAGQAEWKISIFQLLGYALLTTLLGWLQTLWSPTHASSASSASGLSSSAALQALSLGSSLGLFLFIPLLFFGAMGLLYGLARAYGGHGIFVQQVYTTQLFLVPCGIVVSVLGVIPVAGSFLSTFAGVVLFAYCVVLQCFATLAVHQMSPGRAVAAVIITVCVVIVAALVSLALWTFVFVSIFSPGAA